MEKPPPTSSNYDHQQTATSGRGRKLKGNSILSSWRRDGLKQLAARQTNWLKQNYLVTVRYACLIQCFYHFQVPPGTSPSSPSRLSSIL